MSDDSRIPPAEPNGFVPTLNRMGYMTSTRDPVSEEFIRFARGASRPALDVGAAYGIATRELIAAGKEVWMNDLDPRHLDAFESTLRPEERGLLRKLPGDFLSLGIGEGALGAILMCRVLHFFRGEQIRRAATLAARWLAPGGRVHVVCETPYLRNFQAFIPIYEERRLRGVEWPGFISDVAAVAPERAPFLPKEMHLLDPEVLTREFERAGFRTIRCATMARADFPADLQWDGRESVGYVGERG